MHGYTLLLPRGWSQYLLTSFTYAGCLIAGLAERRVQHRESGVPAFPEYFGAVCKAGKEWEDRKASEEKIRWDRKPPGKRPEYGLLGTPFPFKPDWNFLEVSYQVLFDRFGRMCVRCEKWRGEGEGVLERQEGFQVEQRDPYIHPILKRADVIIGG